MCGLLGWIGAGAQRDVAPLERGLDLMQARGPDARDSWMGEGVWLGHRRLAIQDLDPRATQPMGDASGRYRIVYNGEIYNVDALRADLLSHGASLRTRSDTELIVELFARHGEAMLPRLRGMFALAIWDREARRLFVARDPYGIKPLYLARVGDGWLFGSQVKALLATGLVSRTADALGQAGFWLTGSVPEPHTWFRDISALGAGQAAWLDNATETLQATQWWQIADTWRGAGMPAHAEDTQIREDVAAQLRDCVRAHLVADVPVGVFLSGGIDSGALAALMREASSADVHGITIAFREFAGSQDDEAPMAAAIAQRHGIQHHVREIGRAEFDADLPRILAAMDQPSVDGFNTWFASKAVAEQGLKVVVSGVGGDELFLGYGAFRRLPVLLARWKAVSRIPGAGLALSAGAQVQAMRSGNPRWRMLPALLEDMRGAWFLHRGVAAVQALPALMGREAAAEALQAMQQRPWEWIANSIQPLAARPELALAQLESCLYLRNQLLRDSDWASMAHSVELRTPLVDSWLLRGLQPMLGAFARFPQKRLLAQAPRRSLAEDVIQRPKTGFSTPVARWLAERHGPDVHGGVGLARFVAEHCYA